MNRAFAAAAACLFLAGCGEFIAKSDLLGVNEKATPAAQKMKAEADAALTAALAARLPYCTILGNLDLTAQLSPAAGGKAGAGINCPAKPWESGATDAEVIARAVDAAVARALTGRFGPAPTKH